MLSTLTRTISQQPKKLLVVDAAGALLSAFLLGVVLVKFESFFGIPPNVLHILATLPCFFALFDLYSYFKSTGHRKALSAIAIMNLCYCVLSFALIFVHAGTITPFGWAYILGEILIVGLLARLELQVARNKANVHEHV